MNLPMSALGGVLNQSTQPTIQKRGRWSLWPCVTDIFEASQGRSIIGASLSAQGDTPAQRAAKTLAVP